MSEFVLSLSEESSEEDRQILRTMKISCPYCDFKVKSKGGLRQHIDARPECHKIELKLLGLQEGNDTAKLCSKGKENYNRKRSSIWSNGEDGPPHGRKHAKSIPDLKAIAAKLGLADKLGGLVDNAFDAEEEEDELEFVGVVDDLSEGPQGFIGPMDKYQNPEFVWVDGMDVPAPPPLFLEVVPPDYNNDNCINVNPNTEMRDSFKEYCRKHDNCAPFTEGEARGVKLMEKLRNTKASLGTYDAIMEWFHRESGHIAEFETLKHVNNVSDYVSREKLLKTLAMRYNYDQKFASTVTITLPKSRARVTLTRHNAWDCFESLLTDPRVEDSDFNFHGKDPFAPPPPMGMISELHTAKAYSDAYKKFIKFPGRQVLLPVTMYIDGAVTGQFAALPITALKMALGIHRHKHRNKDMAWRTLGLVAHVSETKSRGKNLYHNSGHLDSGVVDLLPDEGEEAAKDDVCKAQDYHTMLDYLLASFVEVQNKGFLWDLRYNGKTYKDVEFVPFVIFIKCDTVEADVLCGSYNSRQKGVAQLCRYCTCPTEHSDHIRASYPKKTTTMIQSMVNAGDYDGLKQMSQQMIQNAWYKVRFSPAPGQQTTVGVHGSCPSEMLHALLLGVFKYTRGCFFDQIGPYSKLSDDIDALAQQFGDRFARQSERNMPGCEFGEGIRKGKLMAKEFRGILLVIAAVLRSDAGRNLLKRNARFDDKHIRYWVLLIEMLLEWEAFLNETEMNMIHVSRLQRKNRFIMYLIKKVANRTDGMGWKLMKFHVIIHMYLDIWLYGVPLEVDTGSNESGHKLTKVAARLTQKNAETFDLQTLNRLDEFHLQDLAFAELNDGQRMWEYYVRKADPTPDQPQPPQEPKTGGDEIRVQEVPKKAGHYEYFKGTSKESRQPCAVTWDEELLRFLCDLQTKLKIKQLKIRTTHTRNGQIFRGSPDYRQKPWRDWAMIDWGDNQYPGHIWCFVIVDTVIPEIAEEEGGNIAVIHGDIRVVNGTYAVIECAYPDQRRSEQIKSDLFLPMLKDVAQTNDGDRPWRRKFLLADVEAITQPLVVIPNIGGKKKLEFFVVRQRQEWVDVFKKWLDASHENDKIGPEEPPRNG